MTGEIKKIEHYTKDGITYITYKNLYEFDSLLLRLEDKVSSSYEITEVNKNFDIDIDVPNKVEYVLDEDNVLVLDRAELILDDNIVFKENDILKQDDILRDYLKFERRKKEVCQPWAFDGKLENHKVELKFTFESEIDYSDSYLALEELDNTTIYLNGIKQDKKENGYFTDKCIKKIKLDKINKGLNTINLIIDFNQMVNLENIFILGKFGVRLNGRYGIITSLNDLIEFGDITSKLLPFYSGNITYVIPIEVNSSSIKIHSNYYKGSLLKISLDDSEYEYITLPPYDKIYTGLKKGKHTIKLKLFGHRQNSFGPLHLMDFKQMPSGPSTFRSEGEKWSDEFIVRPVGLLKSPIIKGDKE